MEIEDFDADPVPPQQAARVAGAGKPPLARGPSPLGRPPEGDFRIAAPGNALGRQGFGPPSEAGDDTLGRDGALKLPPPAQPRGKLQSFGSGSLAGDMSGLDLRDTDSRGGVRPSGPSFGSAAGSVGQPPQTQFGGQPQYGLDSELGGQTGLGLTRSPLPPPSGFGRAGELPPPAGPAQLNLQPPPVPLVVPPQPYGMAAETRSRLPAEQQEVPAQRLLSQQQQQFGLESDIKAEQAAKEADAAGHLAAAILQGGEVDIASFGGARPTDPAQQQLWSQPLIDTFSLDQLPEDQRYFALHARQAERAMLDLRAQGHQPKVVDILDAREKLMDSSAPSRLAYLATVEQAAENRRFPINCRPSLLQTKLKQGSNRLCKLVDLIIEPGNQGFIDLAYTPDGGLKPEHSRVWQFGLSFVQADGVGKTSLRHVRQPCLYIARIGLFDKRSNHFLANVAGIRPNDILQAEHRWVFNSAEKLIVRCCCVQSDSQAGTHLLTDDALSLYVELNVSYRLTVEDTIHMPQNENRASQLVDEVNTCWAMISFKKCASLTREVEISVPLYYGSLYDPQPMDNIYAARRAKQPIKSLFKAKETPVLIFRAGPLGLTGPTPLVPYAYMPSTMLGMHDLGTALGAYRMCLALSLARQSGPFAAVADPVLASFPGILSDHHVLREFLGKWNDITKKMTAIIDTGCCSPQVLPPLPAVVEAFRRCVIELAPLTHCVTIPPKHINNFIEYQGHRLKLVQRFCHVMDPKTGKIAGARHPVEPLSHAGFEYLHAPFDTSEVRLCMADRLENPPVFFKH